MKKLLLVIFLYGCTYNPIIDKRMELKSEFLIRDIKECTELADQAPFLFRPPTVTVMAFHPVGGYILGGTIAYSWLDELVSGGINYRTVLSTCLVKRGHAVLY